MIDDMRARRFSEDTQRDYVRNVVEPGLGKVTRDGLGFFTSLELADLRSRPELLDDGDHRFLAWVANHAIRGNEVWLTKLQSKRLQGLAPRWLNPSETAAWFKRQREAGAPVEAALSDAA
jgi:hypothetical protein